MMWMSLPIVSAKFNCEQPTFIELSHLAVNPDHAYQSADAPDARTSTEHSDSDNEPIPSNDAQQHTNQLYENRESTSETSYSSVRH